MSPRINQRDRIIGTALKLFATRGYDSTPISLISKTAGVSQGLMYNFFKSKEALLGELLQRGIEDVIVSMQSYDQITDPREAIKSHIENTISIIQKHKQFWRLLHAIRLQGKVVELVKHQFQQFVKSVASTFEKVFAQLGYDNPKLEALLFLSQIDGMVILFLQDEKNVPLKALGQHLINKYTK